MINIARIFPTLIVSQMIDIPDEDVNYLKNKALELKNKNNISNSVKSWQCNTFSSLDSYIPHEDNDEKLLNLINTTREIAHEFSLICGCVDKKKVYKEGWHKKVYCTDAWFNVAEYKDYQEYHTHASNHISAVFYLATPKDSGGIVFRNPSCNMFPMPSDNFNSSDNAEIYTIPPKEKLLILFKSSLEHMVQQNMSSDSRISIAMNFKVER